MEQRSEIECWLTDMDGCLVSDEKALPGAGELIEQWKSRGQRFLVLTNNSMFTPRDISATLRQAGVDVPEELIWTSALATARFLQSQCPDGKAYVVGEAGLTTALHEAGYVLTDIDPDYVVVGETRYYSFDAITKAIRLILGGAKFIATNPDPVEPSAEGPLPCTGAVCALITKATGYEPYCVGKPNPMMFRLAMSRIGAHSETTGMIGDSMKTDVLAGIESGLYTVLVRTGVTSDEMITKYPWRPREVLDGVADLLAERQPVDE